jgi:tRNA threonylcarbamoyladenosine biosynthesis protein TsaE
MNISSAIDRTSQSEEETLALGRSLGAACEGGEILVLTGELGAGKTLLVRGLAVGLGCDPGQVRSPSYNLLHRYSGRRTLNHFDVYFTDAAEDLERNLLGTSLEAGEVAVLEWGEQFARALPADRLEIELWHDGPQSRRLQLRAQGARAHALLGRAGLLATHPGGKTPRK